jgi:hypothetical protein
MTKALLPLAIILILFGCAKKERTEEPKATLISTTKFYFNSFVDCNMAEAWVGDTLRIFPGKYGEDPFS